ncbi:unnamed protein product [Closterium sp. Yama58-4]|nr:unnamed protein product [Closterium sp. Yama58-4]
MRLRISRVWKQILRKLGRWKRHAKSMTSSCRTPKVTDGFSDLVVNGVANLPPSKARSADNLGRHLSRSGTADGRTLRVMACQPEKEGRLHIEGDGEGEMDEEWMQEMLRLAGHQSANQVRWKDGGTIQRYGSAVDMRQLIDGDSNETYSAKQRTGTVVPLGNHNGTPWQRDIPVRQHQGELPTASPSAAPAAAILPLTLPMEQDAAPSLRKSRRRNSMTSVPQFEVLPCQTEEVLRGGARASEVGSSDSNHSVRDADISNHAPSEDHTAVCRRFSNIDLRLEMWNLATGSSAKHLRGSPFGARPSRSRSSPIIATPEDAPASSRVAPENDANISHVGFSAAAETPGDALASAASAAVAAPSSCHGRPAQLEVAELPTPTSAAAAAAASPLIFPLKQETAPCKSPRRNTDATAAMSAQFEVLPCQTDEVLRGSVNHASLEDVAVSRRFSNIDLRLEMWNLATGSSASTTTASKHQRGSPHGARPSRSRSSPVIATPEAALSLAPENTNSSHADGYSAGGTSTDARCHPRPAQLEVEGRLDPNPGMQETQEMREPREPETRGSNPGRGAGLEAATSRRSLTRWQSVSSLVTLNSLKPQHAAPRWPLLSDASQRGTVSESVSSAAVSPHGRRFQTSHGVADPVRVGTPPTPRPMSAVVRGAKLSRAASSEPTSNVFEWAAQQRIARHRSALQ